MLSHRYLRLVALLGVVLAACAEPGKRSSSSFASVAAPAPSRGAERAATRLYGPEVAVGKGVARTYVLFDEAKPDVPVEIGVALSESAVNGLPGPNPHAAHQAAQSAHEHLDNHAFLLALPVRGAAPFTFVELDWNPGGHEPPGIYDSPHFDFHFYTISPAERLATVPSDPQFQQKADNLPPESLRPPFYAVAAPPGAPAPGVPLMGVHWIDVRSPELQKMFEKPDAWRPFTTTFIYGSWAGRFTFLEPMITRDYIVSKKSALANEEIAIPTAQDYSPAGYYPSAYRIAWDEAAKEYRIALTQLAWRN